MIKSKPRVIRMERQQKIVIECNVQSGGKPHCIWQRESTVVREDSRHQLIVREENKGEYVIALEIDRPGANDKGMYTLIAKNEKGEVTSQAINVTIDDEQEEQSEEQQLKEDEERGLTERADIGSKPKLIQKLRSEVSKHLMSYVLFFNK